MTIWCIFSKNNDYNQPPRNLVSAFKNKPSTEQIMEKIECTNYDMCNNIFFRKNHKDVWYWLLDRGDRVTMIFNSHIEFEEGDDCPIVSCTGVGKIQEPENCSCHINPPCPSCVNCIIYCNECGFTND